MDLQLNLLVNMAQLIFNKFYKLIVHRTFYCYDDSNNYENEDEEWEWYSDEDEEENIEENDINRECVS